MTRSSERLVLDALPATVYAVDLEGNVTFANRRWDGSGNAPAAGTTIWDELANLASRAQLEQAMATPRGGRAGCSPALGTLRRAGWAGTASSPARR